MIDLDLIDIRELAFKAVQKETRKSVNRSLLTYLEVLQSQR